MQPKNILGKIKQVEIEHKGSLKQHCCLTLSCFAISSLQNHSTQLLLLHAWGSTYFSLTERENTWQF